MPASQRLLFNYSHSSIKSLHFLLTAPEFRTATDVRTAIYEEIDRLKETLLYF